MLPSVQPSTRYPISAADNAPPSRFLRMRSMTRNCDRKRSAGSLEAKTLRQKIGDETLLRAFLALVEDDGARAEFIDDLAAGAAGRAWDSLIVRDARRRESQALGRFWRRRKRLRCARRSWSFHRKSSRRCIPTKTSPFEVRMAAPTLKLEKGAYAFFITLRAARSRRSRVAAGTILVVGILKSILLRIAECGSL